jgi:signal transduction histidine kinase
MPALTNSTASLGMVSAPATGPESSRSGMNSPLRILHLEDDSTDAALIQSTLEAGGIACAITCVQTRKDFVAALERGGLDLILSDFTLPAFDGLTAMTIASTKWPSIPVIIVSGTLGEERAVAALKNGATDYVLKEDLSRLVPAVRRALQEAREREERRVADAQAIEVQKMDVLGQLAAGVAHDFSNILAVIQGHSELMMQKLDPADGLRNHVGEIRHAAQRAVALTRQLLVFSRKETVQPVVLDLNDVVADLENMLLRLINEDIEMTIVPGKQIGRIQADSGYIGQVLMNLVVNARDAMPNGGKLTIATSNVTFDENQARAHPGRKPGDYVMLSVSDTGIGMTDEVKARMFEPLFTTKPKGKGTGLGLPTCQAIVQQSGGHIEVSSDLGVGTTFRVRFPRVDQPLSGTASPFQTGPLERGTETLLVVEDESAVRMLVQAVLEDHGYEVLCACNGQEGLRVAREHKGAPISLVITDLVMPVMGGKVMAEWLKATYPEVKVLFTSGYTDTTGANDGSAFLPKPYTPASLTSKVREVLDASLAPAAQTQNHTHESPEQAKRP